MDKASLVDMRLCYCVDIHNVIGGLDLKKLLSIFVLILLLTGCNSELSFIEISTERAILDVQVFIDEVHNQNGTHLYFDGKKDVYVFLNEKNVEQGNKAIFFIDFDVNVTGDTLIIEYSQEETDDYSNGVIKHQILYKVDLDKEYNTIKAISNGEEVPFSVVSGNQ